MRTSTRPATPKCSGVPRPGRPHDPDGVRVVDHHQRPVAVGQIADRVQPGQIAVHREHPVGGDQAVAGVRCLLQAGLELVHVPVAVPESAGLAQADAVDDRGVVELIGNDCVSLVKQRLEQAAVGVEAGAEEDRVLGAEVGRQPLLERAMERLGAADEPHRRHSVAPAVECLVRGFENRRMSRQTEVVVGAEVDELAPLDGDVGALGAAHRQLALVGAALASGGEPGHQVVAERAVHGWPGPSSRGSPFPIDPSGRRRRPPRTRGRRSGASRPG